MFPQYLDQVCGKNKRTAVISFFGSFVQSAQKIRLRTFHFALLSKFDQKIAFFYFNNQILITPKIFLANLVLA